MALSKNAVVKRVKTFTKDASRARTLYRTLVLQGYTCVPTSEDATPLRQTDRRDAAQFIFFELAAKYEALARDLFMIEVRIQLADSPKRAEYIMGHVDRGLEGVMGWASPKRATERAENLFGKKGFFSRLEHHLGTDTYQRLTLAHKVRNHIAHSGTDVYRKALQSLRVPAGSRKGCSPGRVLIEYPSSAAGDDRWFHRFVAAYETFGQKAASRLKAVSEQGAEPNGGPATQLGNSGASEGPHG